MSHRGYLLATRRIGVDEDVQGSEQIREETHHPSVGQCSTLGNFSGDFPLVPASLLVMQQSEVKVERFACVGMNPGAND